MSPTPTATSETSTPVPSPSSPTAQAPASVTVPSSWTVAPQSLIDAAGEDPAVVSVVGVWILEDGTEASVVETTNQSGQLDPEALFASMFGGLGPSDGVDVEHRTGTTSAGDPLLTVTITPAGGLGGDAQAMFYVCTPTTIVSGVATTSVEGLATVADQLDSVSASVDFG